MPSSGDEITYTYSGSKVTEDVSGIDDLLINRIDGAGSDSFGVNQGVDSAGGHIEEAYADISSYSTLEIWVGGEGQAKTSGSIGGWGRNDGGAGGSIPNGDDFSAAGGGGSTEILADGVFIAAADGGGGDGYLTSDDAGDYYALGGGGGGRGGSGLDPHNDTGETEGTNKPGEDGEGTGQGGDGGYGAPISPDAQPGDGGQELGIAELGPNGATQTGGGSTGEAGEITLVYGVQPAPDNVTATENLATVGPTVDLNWSNFNEALNHIYRSDISSPTFPDDYAEIGTAAAGEESFTDNPPDFETTYTYRVTAETTSESDPSDPVTITTSSAGELLVTITGTNSPVTTGDTLNIDVQIENIGDYRAEKDIDAVLEPQ